MIVQSFMMFTLAAKLKLRQWFCDESGEVNIVTIVVLIGIAVLLALVFKKRIETLLETLFGTITENARNAVGGGGASE